MQRWQYSIIIHMALLALKDDRHFKTHCSHIGSDCRGQLHLQLSKIKQLIKRRRIALRAIFRLQGFPFT